MPRALKVYRTAIGFHDAYVAAPSQKAALEAWGADVNLFARGVAELVTDEALVKEPLAAPGKVIKRARGSIAEHLAALPADEPAPRQSAKPASPRKPARPKPRPSRRALEEAEEALARLEEVQAGERKDLARREAALKRERQALEKKQAADHARLEEARNAEQARYEKALRAWDGE
ncbi:hypothetical protein [Sphingobium bisphenolivorans]|uniref:hypothetical protein n=1 Tax=Sphingobium bisphenolivorans TaxID=1335760 RepID=UPI00039BD13F|nr:hypothetical protein [Sphingobium bisphenolivorans]